MNHPNPNPHADDAPSTPNDEHWWPRLVDHINTWWMDRRPTGPALRQALRIPPKPATALILAALAGTTTAVGVALWWVISGVIGMTAGIATGIRDTATDTTATGTHNLVSWSLTRTITHPAHAYLDEQAAGLPVPAHTLWLAWLGTTLGLFILAVVGSRGARLGWIIAGATTTAMVYAGTPTDGREVAAGLALTVWAVLSVAAFNRLFPAGRPVCVAVRLLRQPDSDSD